MNAYMIIYWDEKKGMDLTMWTDEKGAEKLRKKDGKGIIIFCIEKIRV